MTHTGTEGDSGEHNIPIDATFVDGFDVDDEEDRWSGTMDAVVLPRIRHMTIPLFRGR